MEKELSVLTDNDIGELKMDIDGTLRVVASKKLDEQVQKELEQVDPADAEQVIANAIDYGTVEDIELEKQ